VKLVFAPCESSQAAQRYSERAHGVPDTDEFDLGVIASANAIVLPELCQVRIVGMTLRPIQGDRVSIMLNELAPENTAFPDHPYDAARRECSATETEEKEFVVAFVIRNEEPIGVVNVIFQTLAESASGVAVDQISGPYALVIVDNLRRRAIALCNPVGDLDDVGGTRSAVMLLICAIPGSVATKNQSFHNKKPGRERTQSGLM
jgi:hypothetical protein